VTISEARPLLDVNVLLALADPRHAYHEAAHCWLDTVEGFCTTPLTEAALLRLLANPKVGGETMASARNVLRQIRLLESHSFLPDNSSLDEPAFDLLTLAGYRQVTDFHLVNLAIQAGATFATFDGRLLRSLDPAAAQYITVIAI